MIYLGADHRGYNLKEKIKPLLKEWGYQFEDLGNTKLVEDDDYPDFAYKVAKKVAENPKENKGILICGSGVGEAIAANKIKGIRAGLSFTEAHAEQIRHDDDTNILALPADYLEIEDVEPMVKIWLETPFSGEERHLRRIKKIEKIEKDEQ